MTTMFASVDVATVWSSPDAPRGVDAPAVIDEPDLAAWLSALTPELRLGLHGRTLTQLLRGEPVLVVEERSEWVRIAAPWQPSPDDTRGYPGWVRRSHLSGGGHPSTRGAATAPISLSDTAIDAMASHSTRLEPQALRQVVMDRARQFVNLRYLWGGMSPWGFDCSGLVHFSCRLSGLVVPRDAAAQHAASTPVPLGDEEAGDLYFFTNEKGRVAHVGFVAGDEQMLHAPEEGGSLIEEAPLEAERRRSLIGAGRLTGT